MRWLLLIAALLFCGQSFSNDPNDHKTIATKNQKAQKEKTVLDTSSLEKTIRESIKEASEKSDPNADEKLKSERDLVKYTAQLAFDTERLTDFNKLLVIFTAILSVVAVGQLYMFWKQLRLMKIAVQDGAKVANAAVRIHLPVLRPIPSDLTKLDQPIPEDGGSYGGGDVGLFPARYSAISWVVFKNHGRSEAFPISLSTGWMVTKNLPSQPAYNLISPVSHAAVIKVGDEISIDLHRTIELSDAEITALKTEQSWLWFYGSLNYADFMGEERESRFCWRWARRHPDDISSYFASDGSPPEAYTKQT